MKKLLMTFMLLTLAPFVTFAGDDGTIGSLPDKGDGGGMMGDKGVAHGTCWKRGGTKVHIKVVGTIHGDQKITATSGGDEDSGSGTPASDNGCRESEVMSAGGTDFRIKGGKTQMKDDDGKWRTMSETDDPCQDDEGEED